MKGRLVLLGLLVAGWVARGQPLPPDRLTGTWAGVHTELGPAVYCPLPVYIDFRPDSTYRLGLIDGSTPDRTFAWRVAGDTLRLGPATYAPGLVNLVADTLRIGTVFPMTFRRFRDTPADSVVVRSSLANRTWQTDSVRVHFHENARLCWEDRTTGRRTQHYWRLARFGQSVFVLMQGSQYKSDGHYKAIWQVSQVARGSLQITGWNGGRVAVETCRLVSTLAPGDSCRATDFQPCDNCFAVLSAYSIGSYLSPSVRYGIQKLIRQTYQPVALTGQSGLIQVRFVLNCAGEIGSFTVQAVDDDYCPRLFDRRITNQLTAICRQPLVRLLTADSTQSGEHHDRAVTLNIRLKDGSLTDIFP